MCHKGFKVTLEGYPHGHKHKGFECVGARYLPPQTPEPYPTEPTEEEKLVPSEEPLDSETEAA